MPNTRPFQHKIFNNNLITPLYAMEAIEQIFQTMKINIDENICFSPLKQI